MRKAFCVFILYVDVLLRLLGTANGSFVVSGSDGITVVGDSCLC